MKRRERAGEQEGERASKGIESQDAAQYSRDAMAKDRLGASVVTSGGLEAHRGAHLKAHGQQAGDGPRGWNAVSGCRGG